MRLAFRKAVEIAGKVVVIGMEWIGRVFGRP
jgi:hypothetical protein